MTNTMGFKKIDKLPERKRRSIYDDVIELVARTADMYALDTKDVKRCNSLTNTLRLRIKKLGVPVKVIVRDTMVCLVRQLPLREDEVDEPILGK